MTTRWGQESKLPESIYMALYKLKALHILDRVIHEDVINLLLRFVFFVHLHDADPRSRFTKFGRSGSREANDWTIRGSNTRPPS